MTDTEDLVPEDFIDFLKCLKNAKCTFVVVGAYALAVNGHPRATQDIDIWVKPDDENAQRVYRALVDFGAPIKAHGIAAKDFATTGNVYQIGLPPVRIDVLTSIAGVSFDEAESGFTKSKLGDELVSFLGIDAQIRNKRAAGRTKDIADAEALEVIRAQNKS